MTDKGPRRAVRESVGRECACARKNDASYVALFWKTNSWDPFSATSEAEIDGAQRVLRCRPSAREYIVRSDEVRTDLDSQQVHNGSRERALRPPPTLIAPFSTGNSTLVWVYVSWLPRSIPHALTHATRMNVPRKIIALELPVQWRTVANRQSQKV